MKRNLKRRSRRSSRQTDRQTDRPSPRTIARIFKKTETLRAPDAKNDPQEAQRHHLSKKLPMGPLGRVKILCRDPSLRIHAKTVGKPFPDSAVIIDL